MSVLDLGVENVGEFYAEHYLATVLDQDLREVISQWERDGKSSPPWHRLRALQRPFEQLRSRASEIRDPVARWRESHAFHVSLLEALGYAPRNEVEALDGNSVVPAMLSLSREGAPWLVAFEAPIALGDDSSALDDKPLAAQLSPDVDASTLADRTWREILDEGIFARDEPEPPRWVLFLAGDELTLIDRWKWPQAACLRFDLARLLGVRTEEGLRALAALLHRECLAPDHGEALHDGLDERSHKHAYAASEDLKHGARQAVEILANEVVAQLRARNEGVFNRPTLAQELTRDCLVYLYRLLFLFYVEARGAELGVVPANNEEYRRGYALEFLRDLELVPLTSEASRNGHYLHHSLQRLFRLVDEGFPRYREQLELTRDEGMIHHGFVVPGLRSALFDTSRTKHIDRVSLRNEALQRVLACLSLTREGARQRGRISYAQLGINQLGAVYEGLLSYTGFFATDALYEVRAPGTHHDPEARTWFVPEREIARYDAKTEVVRDAKGEPLTHPKGSFLYRLAGRDREKTASYYTPEVLTRCLTKYTLQERLAGLSASDILELTVCEPAMGSGAFLNEAVTQLADAYLARRQEELGQRIPSAQFEAERQRVKFHVATRQVYGVDLTPMAAELGKVSLWLNVLGKALPAPWFDARIATGNSLLGARREVFSVADLRPAKGKKAGAWLDKQPAKVRIGEVRPEGSVWHFLVADAGMCPFDQDKVVKSLAPEAVTAIKAWRKAQSVPFEMLDEARLSQLSDRVDTLFERHVADRDELLAQTRQSIALWGAEATSPRVPSLLECEERRAKMLLATAPGERLRAVMNYWCALWFWPVSEAAKLPSRDAWLSDLEALLGLPGEADAERLAIVDRVTQRMRFFHWELSFPEVFARGGFDVIVGNPPWLKVTWDEAAVLTDFDPSIALRDLSSNEARNRRETLLQTTAVREVFFEEFESVTGMGWFLGAATNYPLLLGAQNNLYKCFFERAMSLSPHGAIGFIHQKGLYDDANSGKLRGVLLPRLVWRFTFLNQTKLFSSIHNALLFELSVLGRPGLEARFSMISGLLHPRTIDESLSHDGVGQVPGVKGEDDEWDIRGHLERVIKPSEELRLASRVVFGCDETSDDTTRVPLIHAVGMTTALCSIARAKTLGATGGQWKTTGEWNETTRIADGSLRREIRFPAATEEWVLAGPHFHVANPFYKTPNAECRHNKDYSSIDLETLPADYLPRTLYVPNAPPDRFYECDPEWQGKRLTQHFRHVHREMITPSGERSMVSALMPPGPAQVNSVMTVACRTNRETVIFNGLASSLLVDFMIRAMGVGHVNATLTERLPCEVPEKYEALVMARVLRLNCLTVHYADLWAELFPLLRADDGFTKRDPRLGAWTQSPVWTREVALRRAYARRQALVELDALAALALGVTIDDLALVYRVQFPVLQEYERDTWYDAEGRIVFTVNKGLPGVGLSRDVWERVKNAKAGESLPGEAAKWVPPFDRCDRERDLREAYRVFGGG